ncbi:MAG: class I SAM-dependent methyltransferase [Candidatus Omnitrophota bacterium]
MNKKGFRYYIFKACLKTGNLFKLLGDFFCELPVAVIPQKNLTDITDIYFNHKKRVAHWSKNSSSGLSVYEKEFVERYNVTDGRFLVIASGSGREAFGIAEKCPDVTAIDVSEGLIRFSRERAERENVKNTDFRCVSMHEFKPEKKFDYIFFSGRSYGYIPTRRRRIEFLKKLKTWMNPEGKFLLSFVMQGPLRGKRRYFYPIYKALAYLAFGNREIEKGDIMMGEEWHHVHTSDEEITSEVKQAGFEIEKFGKEKGTYLFLKPKNVE